MAAVHIRMGNAAEDRKIFTMFLEQLQIRRCRVIASATLGEKAVGQHAKIVADAEHAAWRGVWRQRRRRLLRSTRKSGEHRIQEWQSHRDPNAAQKSPARQRRTN